MYLPSLDNIDTSRNMIEIFKGYNHNLRINNGEFYDMKNLTSDHYPTLSPRRRRGSLGKKASAVISKDNLCWVDEEKFYINNYPIEIGLNSEPKQLISMGAYVIIMPDKVWVNTLAKSGERTWGYIENEVVITSEETTKFSMSKMDGTDIGDNIPSGDTAPENPENLSYWVDTSSDVHSLKQWNASTEMWSTIATTYIKISAPGIGRGFEKYDGVFISGLKENTNPDLNKIDGSFVLWDVKNDTDTIGDDYIVIVGLLDTCCTINADITIKRKMPEMEYIIESGNRLWGCHYGLNETTGEVVNEIYASKLGDFKNWNSYLGVSTDSYAVSCGTDGPWTGAITHLGYPLFFKENYIHKIYGNYPANYQVQTTACRGVEKGSHKSLVIVNEILYYKGRTGICAYDGSLPQEISYRLGNRKYSDAVAGSHGNKYYISMKDIQTQEYVLMFYDTALSMWYKTDNTRVKDFCSCKYNISTSESIDELFFVDENDNLRTMFGGGEVDTNPVEWMAETGILGTDMPDKKYISRLTVRMMLTIGARVNFFAQYDSAGSWEHLGTMTGRTLKSFTVPIRPKRCDHLRLKIVGTGDAKIFSIVKTVEQGSDY